MPFGICLPVVRRAKYARREGLGREREGRAVKILVADDHALFRDGLRYLLGQLGEPVEVIEARDGAEALELAGAHPDLELVLLDLGMPGIDGLAGLRLLRE